MSEVCSVLPWCLVIDGPIDSVHFLVSLNNKSTSCTIGNASQVRKYKWNRCLLLIAKTSIFSKHIRFEMVVVVVHLEESVLMVEPLVVVVSLRLRLIFFL